MPLKVFITGGTSGIGLALATLYAEEGHSVGLCGEASPKLPGHISRGYPNISTYECDVTDREALKNRIREFAGDKLHVMIANAGISVGKKTKRPNFDQSHRVMETNVFGVLNAFEAGPRVHAP